MSIARIYRASAALAALAIATTASAGAALAADTHTKRPEVSSLPQVQMSPPTGARAPASIGANEKLPGFHVGSMPGAGHKGAERPSYVMLFPSKAAADAMFGRVVPGEAAEQDGACLSMSHGEDGARGPLSSSSAMSVLSIPTRADLYGTSTTVRAVRSERLVISDADGGGKATLEITDAWVDPNTRGVRLARRTSMPMVKVATGLGGLDVYAARDGMQAVELVVRTATADPRRGRPGMTMTIVGGNTVGNSTCGHARARLKIEKGGADMVTLNGEVTLPSSPGDDPKPAAAAPKADGGGDPGVLARVFGATPGQTLRMREIKQRQVRISGSTTWTSRDAEPVLSVSFGWLGRERTMQVPSF